MTSNEEGIHNCTSLRCRLVERGISGDTVDIHTCTSLSCSTNAAGSTLHEEDIGT